VPTAKENGLDYQMSIWAGIFAPKGTPKAIVDKLAAALDKDFPVKDLREFVDYLKKNGDTVKQAHGGIGASSSRRGGEAR
jgi:tripartite-type tricarboxylate transporter receptor subunit TctC